MQVYNPNPHNPVQHVRVEALRRGRTRKQKEAVFGGWLEAPAFPQRGARRGPKPKGERVASGAERSATVSCRRHKYEAPANEAVHAIYARVNVPFLFGCVLSVCGLSSCLRVRIRHPDCIRIGHFVLLNIRHCVLCKPKTLYLCKTQTLCLRKDKTWCVCVCV